MMNKFKVGDKIVGLKESNNMYSITNEKNGFVGEVVDVKTEDELYKALNENKHIIKKELKNNVVSYNFSRDAFDKGIWNNIITKARGLFINKKTQNVVARSYDKYFNLFENDEYDFDGNG